MRQSGISLVELLVSVTILALATTVALVVYDQARLAYKHGENVTEQQQVARVALDVISSDVRMAGFNTNPDGNPGRPDEQIEAAYATAITVRADYDADDPVDSGLPEQTLGGAGAAFRAVSTGNDEIVSYVLAKPDGSSGDTLAFGADVGAAVRDASIEDVTVGSVDLAQSDPPYTLYKVVLENDPTGCCGTSFARRIPIVDNVRSLRFRYYDRSGNEITAPGGEETQSAIATRSRIRRVGVEIEALTRDSDPHWRDVDDTDPDTQLFRKFRLSGEVVPPNLGRVAIHDLQADSSPPSRPSSPSLYPGHCEGLFVDWPPNPAEDDAVYYRVAYGTDPATLERSRSSVLPGLYLAELDDGVTYHVAVQAVDEAGNFSSISPVVQATTTNDNTPDVTQSLAAIGGDGQIDLTWDATLDNTTGTAGDPDSPKIRDLAGYRVYRSTSPGLVPSFGNRIADEASVLNLSLPQFVDDTVAACKQHFYKVTAVDACGIESLAGDEVDAESTSSVDPEQPYDVQAFRTGASQVTVNWSPVVRDLDGKSVYIDTYKIYRSPSQSASLPDPVGWSYLDQVGGGATQYIDPVMIPPGETRHYLVQAVDECSPPNVSLLSDPASPTCNFSGRVEFREPDEGDVVSGTQNLRVVVVGAIGTALHDWVEWTLQPEGAGPTVVATSSGPGPAWDYTWVADPAGTPPFAPGTYWITAKVQQRLGIDICHASRSIRVTIDD